MSYQVKYRLEHKTNINGTDVTYKIDILKDLWGGGVTTIKGDKSSGVFNLFTPDLNPRKPLDTPIQKGELELMLVVSDQLSYNGLDIIDEILEGEEDTFRMDLYIDNAKHWSGFILPDLMEYPEGEYVFSASIIAKDLTLMEDDKFPLLAENSFEPIIKTIADCLKQTGLNLPIQTHTNITATDINETEDFLKWFYHDQYAFRKFNNENADEKIPYTEVLEELLTKYNLIVRQGNGHWIIEQLPAVAKGDALQFNYDTNGNDITDDTNPNDVVGNGLNRHHVIDRQDSFILPKSKNQIAQAIKRIEHSYDHRSQFVTLSIDDEFNHVDPTDSTSFQTSIEQDGDIKVRIDGSSLQLLQDNDLGWQTATVYIQLRVEGESPTRYWDRASDSWTITETDIEYLFAGEGFVLSSSVFEVETTAIPQNLGNSNIIIEFKWADVTGSGNVEEIKFEGFSSFLFTDNNIEKSDRLDFTFERDGNYSVVDKMGESRIGQGVSQFAKGAVATLFNGEIVPIEDIFRVRDGGEFLPLEHLLMRERMNFQRSYIRSLSMNLKANYSINQLISYRGDYWFPLGYRLDGAESDNEVTCLQLNYKQGDFSDVYNKVIVMPETGGSTSSSVGGGGSSSGSTLWGAIIENPFDTNVPSDFAVSGHEHPTSDIDFERSVLTGASITTESDVANLPRGFHTNYSYNSGLGGWANYIFVKNTGTRAFQFGATHGDNVWRGRTFNSSGATNYVTFLHTGNSDMFNASDYVPKSGGTFTGDMSFVNGNAEINHKLNGNDYSQIIMRSQGTAGDNYFISYGENSTYHPQFAMKNNQADGELTFYTAGTKRLTIQPNGTIDIGGNLNINSSILLDASTGISHANDHLDLSDRRIKEVIDSDVDPLNFARNARLHYYDKRGLKQFGLFAQDLMKADNRVVGTIDDDEFGELYTLSGYSVASIALAGVGKVDTKVERLEKRVNELEEKVRQLGGVA